MNKQQITLEGVYVTPRCTFLPVIAEGVLCESRGASAEGFDPNEDSYNWGE